MFSGVGGFELGLERASNSQSLSKIEQDGQGGNGIANEQGALLCPGSIPAFRCVGLSEFNKYSNQVLAQKFPTIKNWGDCTKINPSELPDFDMLCGGFPCQSFSIAGKRRGFEDTRGTMFFEIARILKIKRPKIILLENVKGLLNHNKGETFKVILQTLDELGYEVQWMVLNSKFFGVPQNRERVFIIGNLRGTSRPEILPFREDDKILTRENDPGTGQSQTQTAGTVQSKIRADGNFVQRWPLRFPNRNQKNIEGDYAYTIDSCHTGGIREGMQIRRLTPIECCRLQGFPDDWNDNMSDTQRYKQMGNAVTVNVIAAISSQILNKNKSKVDLPKHLKRSPSLT